AFASSGGWSQSVAHADSQPRTQPRMAAGIAARIEFIRAPRRTYTQQSNEPRDQAMDVWVLGVAAIVLIGLTLWIVSQAPSTDATVTTPEARDLPPVGDAFEDQYTSATADLSAGGVAEAMITRPPPITESLPAPTPFQSASEPWSSPSTARGGAPVAGPAPKARGRRVIGIGA